VSANETIETLMKRSYGVELTESDGRFWMEIAELHLLVDGASAGEAFDKLSAEKKRLFEQYVAAGKTAKVPMPDAERERQALGRALKPFLIKASVVAFIGVLLVVAANVSVFYLLDTAPKSVAKKAGRAAIQNLQNFAAEEMTPEKQQKLRLAMRAAVAKLQPFSAELAPLFPCEARARSTN
jgi:hypothetical protein